MQTTLNWYKLRLTDTDYTQLMQTTLNWYKLHSTDTDFSQLN